MTLLWDRFGFRGWHHSTPLILSTLRGEWRFPPLLAHLDSFIQMDCEKASWACSLFSMASGCEKEEASQLEPSLGPGWAGLREKCFLGTQVSGMERLLSKGGI